MKDTPVVLLSGPRQAGKTTLVRQASEPGRKYLTLDDATTLLSAREDPVGLIRQQGRVVIDEIQRAPQLLLAIKQSVDNDRQPGRFLLTGSANLLTLPTVADSLAGRMETLTLLPLSQSEVQGTSTNWLDEIFSDRIPLTGALATGNELIERVLRGGYPEALTRRDGRRRSAWFRHYIDAIIQRDVRDVAGVHKLDELPRFLRALAQTAGQMCNYSQLGGQIGLDGKTAARYIGIFEQVYFLRRVDVWARNHLSRVIKSPKLQFIDSGLLSTLVNLPADVTRVDRARLGHVLETFVFSELFKHQTTADGDYRLMYYRDIDRHEVDLVVENASGDLVGIEIKAAASVNTADLKGLKKLASLAEGHFKMGIVLYDGADTLSIGDRLWAVPLSTLWSGDAP